MGSAAAQKTPPPASSVQNKIAIHLKLSISGFGRLPKMTRPVRPAPTANAIKKVASSKICQKGPKILADHLKPASTIVANCASAKIAIRTKTIIKPPLYQNAGFFSPNVSVSAAAGAPVTLCAVVLAAVERPCSSWLSPFKSAMMWLHIIIL